MSMQSWQETLVASSVDGPALTAAAAATCIPAAARITLPNNLFRVGQVMKLTAAGRISCAVTTPGTARFDVRLGGAVAFDSLAMSLNVVAKTSVGWWLEVLMTVRAIGSGTSANLMGHGTWQSEAVVGAPLPTVGGAGSLILPFNTPPVVGSGFDSTAALSLDMFFTQTVATGSMTVHQYRVELLN